MQCTNASTHQSPSLQVKPDPPNPSISDGYPTPTDKIILSFGHAPLNFESIADAAYDGLIWILAQTSGPRGGKWQTDPVPGGNYKRLEESYQIDIGTDLYSEKDMTYIDLTFVFKLIYKFARLYQLREFKIQWLKGGKPHVYGELKNRARLAGSQGNGANVA